MAKNGVEKLHSDFGLLYYRILLNFSSSRYEYSNVKNKCSERKVEMADIVNYFGIKR